MLKNGNEQAGKEPVDGIGGDDVVTPEPVVEPQLKGRDQTAVSVTGTVNAPEHDKPASTDPIFPHAPPVDDEFTLPLYQLVIGADHPNRSYDLETGVGEALFHAALDPAALARSSCC